MVFPQIKRKLNSFFTKEDGRISKNAIIKIGVLGSFIIGATIMSGEDVIAADKHGKDHANYNVVGNIKHANEDLHCKCTEHRKGNCNDHDKCHSNGGDISDEYIHHENSIEVDQGSGTITVKHNHNVIQEEVYGGNYDSDRHCKGHVNLCT